MGSNRMNALKGMSKQMDNYEKEKKEALDKRIAKSEARRQAELDRHNMSDLEEFVKEVEKAIKTGGLKP